MSIPKVFALCSGFQMAAGQFAGLGVLLGCVVFYFPVRAAGKVDVIAPFHRHILLVFKKI